jgi:hypothetical protein
VRFGKASWRRPQAALAGLAGLASVTLGGCVEQAAEVAPNAAALRPPLEKRAGVSLAAATVSIVSVNGAPDAVGGPFLDALKDAAHTREIVLTDAKAAHYLVRGYLSVATIQDGVEVEYVWDVFGPDKRRAFRLNDVLDVKGSGDDPWQMVTDAALKSVADKSADDLAAFLSQTPEAKPVAEGSPSGAGVALSYAATQ